MITNLVYCYYMIIQISGASSVVDLMKLKRIHNMKKKGGRNKDKTESVLSAQTPGLCFDFHPTVSL